MVVKFFDTIQREAEYFFGFGICTADKEELPVFYDMGKIIIGSITPVTDIDIGSVRLCTVNHLAKGTVLIAFACRLDEQVNELFIMDGKHGIDMDLVEAFCGFTIWFKKSILVIWVSKNINGRPVTSH